MSIVKLLKKLRREKEYGKHIATWEQSNFKIWVCIVKQAGGQLQGEAIT